jgi:lantibiotic biosynthesis protein
MSHRTCSPEAASHALVDHLLSAAVRDGERCAFHGAAPAPQLGQAARWRVFAGDYYEGSAGIARALAFAGRLLERQDALDTARAAMRHAVGGTQGWSLHSGALGVALVAAELSAWLDIDALQETARQIAGSALDEALRDAEHGRAGFDWMSGLAGALYAAQELRALDSALGEYAAPLAQALAAAAETAAAGCSWPMHPQDSTHLCGFGHGAAGIALALQRAAPSALQQVAAAAREFEALHFHPAACSWADLRADAGGHPHYWCHGSVGIAIERREALASGALSQTSRERAGLDYSAALLGVRREACRLLDLPQGAAAGFELNASQCHGLSGMLDLLLDSGCDEDLSLAQAIGECIRRDARRPQGFRCGLPSGEPTPGLMLGWAGILWGQLRLLDRNQVPRAWAPLLRSTDTSCSALETQGDAVVAVAA